MNPPSAIHGAMGRERKPFTYTPGGLDLSEIKSERMAKRLMRNAMNQGVPEQPQNVQSPTGATPIAVPNFNCLPVQVFPAFQLPANPKSLLRTRSTPDQPKEPLMSKAPPPSQAANTFKPSEVGHLRETINNNTQANSQASLQSYPQVNNNNSSINRPTSLYECSATNNVNNFANTRYGSDESTIPILPEICYDAQYFEAAPRTSNKNETLDTSLNSENMRPPTSEQRIDVAVPDYLKKPLQETNIVTEPVLLSKPVEDRLETNYDEQVETKLLYIYYLYIYMFVYVVCYSYLIYNIKNL